MQGNNVLVMPPHTASPNPEDVSSVWRAVHKLEKEFESLTPVVRLVQAPKLSVVLRFSP